MFLLNFNCKNCFQSYYSNRLYPKTSLYKTTGASKINEILLLVNFLQTTVVFVLFTVLLQ